MKQTKKQLVCLVLLFAMLLPHFAYAKANVTDTLQNLITYEYPEGSVFDTSFDGGISCFGFAKMVVNRLFGEDSNGKIRTWNYAGESSTGMLVLDRLYNGEYSPENIRNMMSKARPGCVIQRNVDTLGASQHTMIFLSAGKNSFQVYDCNAQYDNVVHIREIGYDDWEKKTFLNVTLLIPDNYPGGATPPAPQLPENPSLPHSPPRTEKEISSRLNTLMKTNLPIGSYYEPGISSKNKDVLFAQEVLQELFGTKHEWSSTSKPERNMQLIDRIFYGEYDQPERLASLFSKASPGDVIQLSTGPYDRAHCMIFLSTEEESVWVYDADRSNDGIIRKRNLPYATRFHNGTWQNISILRASEHPISPPSSPENPNYKPSPTPTPKPDPIDFVDVPKTHWAYPHIAELVRLGIAQGKAPAHFYPDETVTRAEFIAFLFRMSKNTNRGNVNTTFRDIHSNDWYADAVLWANSHGIAYGDANGYFHPNAPVTREDLSVMLVRFMKIYGYTPNGTQSVDAYYDRAAISSYARPSVDALTRAGIVSGKRLGFFAPKENATRAECSKILHKSLLSMKKHLS